MDAAAFRHSTVSIAVHFGETDRNADPTLLGVRATAWFLTPRSIVTAAHVAYSMRLSDREWKEVEVLGVESRQSTLVRVQQLSGAGVEKIAVLELREALAGAQPLAIRRQALVLGESASSLGYPGNTLRFAAGRFIENGEGEKFAGTALFELSDGNDRLVLDHGASGAPIFDCDGRVVAVVSNIFTTTFSFMSQPIRVSTAWGKPNIAAVPISALEEGFDAK